MMKEWFKNWVCLPHNALWTAAVVREEKMVCPAASQ